MKPDIMIEAPDVKQIEREFAQGLQDAEVIDGEKVSPGGPGPTQSGLNLDRLALKSVYKIKKALQVRVLSSDVPEAIKPKLSHLSKVEDSEIEVLKLVLDRYGSENLSPEWIEMINKYLNTPLWPWLEMELELHQKLKAEIKVIVDRESKGA